MTPLTRAQHKHHTIQSFNSREGELLSACMVPGEKLGHLFLFGEVCALFLALFTLLLCSCAFPRRLLPDLDIDISSSTINCP